MRERYVKTADSGPRAYAEPAMQVDPEFDEAALHADAVVAVQRFFVAQGLGGSGVA